MDEYIRELARFEGADIGIDRGFVLTLSGSFTYAPGGAGQGFGLYIDGEFIKRFMGAFNAERLSAVNGRIYWVTHNLGDIRLIEPVFSKDGKPFDVQAWKDEKQAKRETNA